MLYNKIIAVLYNCYFIISVCNNIIHSSNIKSML